MTWFTFFKSYLLSEDSTIYNENPAGIKVSERFNTLEKCGYVSLLSKCHAHISVIEMHRKENSMNQNKTQ